MFVRLLILVTFWAYCKGDDHERLGPMNGYINNTKSNGQISLPDGIKTVPGTEYRYDYTYSEEANGWLKLHFSPMNWEDARLQCYHEGAVLASPLNEKLVLGLKKLLQSQTMVPTAMFSGVHSLFASGIYTSVEGVPLEKMTVQWGGDEPKYISEGSGCLVFSSQGTMASRNCNDRFPFICYKEHSDLVLSECGTSDKEYERIDPETNANCYKCHKREEEWSKAFAICQAEGAYLAIMNRAQAAEFSSWKFRKLGMSKAFMGFKNIGGTWWDIHGNLMDPSLITTTPNTVIAWGGDYVATHCEEKHSFICEKTVDSLLLNKK